MLHIFSKSPLLPQHLDRVEDGDVLLFIESGVYSLIRNSTIAEMLQIKQKSTVFYTLESDLRIRGLMPEQLLDDVQITDYAGFVQLTVDNQVIHSWH